MGKFSKKYGVKTEYIRNVHHGSFDDIRSRLLAIPRAHSRYASFPGLADNEPRDVFLFSDGEEDFVLMAWLTPSEITYFASASGEQALGEWLTLIRVDVDSKHSAKQFLAQ